MARAHIKTQYTKTMLILGILVFSMTNFILFTLANSSRDYALEQISGHIFTVLSEKITDNYDSGDRDSLNRAAELYTSHDSVIFIELFDNQRNVLYTVDNQKNFPTDVIKESVFLIHPVITASRQIEGSNELLPQRKLGDIELRLKKQSADFQSQNLLYQIIINIIILSIWAGLWIRIQIRQNATSKNLGILHNAVNYGQDKEQLLQSMITAEGYELAENILEKTRRRLHIENQLKQLKYEINQARQDGNTDLLEFIEFLRHNRLEQADETLQLFYRSITMEGFSQESHVYCRDETRQIITQLSELCSEYQVTMFDDYTGDVVTSKSILNKQIYSNLIQITLEQLIQICGASALRFSFDHRKNHGSQSLIRISISSEAYNFQKALSMQSFFQFSPKKEISAICNNINLISVKYLLRKLSGEYFYFKDEVRFEIPCSIVEEELDLSDSLSIEPLERDLSALIFDSDPVDKIAMLGYLEKLNVHTEKATTKQVVLQKLRRERCDILIVNSNFLKDADPYFYGNFKNEIQSAQQPPKILVASSDLTILQDEKFKELRCLFLSKPIDAHVLKETLENI